MPPGKPIVIEWDRSGATDAPPGAPEHLGRSHTSCLQTCLESDWSLLLEVLQLIKKTIPTNSDRPRAEVLEVVRKALLALPLTLEFLEL
jgi:hypothetical protein